MKSQRAHLITGSNAPTSNLTEAWYAITLLLFGIFELTLGPKTLSSFGTWWISFHLDKFLLAKLMWQSGGSFADSKLDRLVASPVNSYQHSILLHSLVVGGSSRHFECATKERMVSHLQHATLGHTGNLVLSRNIKIQHLLPKNLEYVLWEWKLLGLLREEQKPHFLVWWCQPGCGEERENKWRGQEAEQSQKQLAAALLKKAKVKPCQTQDWKTHFWQIKVLTKCCQGALTAECWRWTWTGQPPSWREGHPHLFWHQHHLLFNLSWNLSSPCPTTDPTLDGHNRRWPQLVTLKKFYYFTSHSCHFAQVKSSEE